jgi:(1->4)-alpha-D-glucan 1-alpha-D-glucosylmutase
LRTFLERILDRSSSDEFLNSLETLARRTSLLGALNSLSQITLKATIPGVPDFYQGTEFWDLSLVDPDNRRPVDFAERAAVLASVENSDWESLAQNWPNGHIKLAWIRHLLKLRTESADVFAQGDYQPLQVSGPHRDHVIAFARRRGRDAAIVAVAKSFAPIAQGGRVWPRAEAFDGVLNLYGYSAEGIADAPEVRLSALFRHLPAAVLKVRFEGALTPARKHMPA